MKNLFNDLTIRIPSWLVTKPRSPLNLRRGDHTLTQY